MSASVAVPWWQSWWAIIIGLVVCLPVGLIALWMRKGTSVGVKAAVSAVAVVILVLALVSTPDETAPVADPVDTPTSAAPSPSPSETEVQAVSVPDVSGLSASKAQSQLQNAGLSVVIVKQPSGQKTGSVIGQRPDPGTKVTEGENVTLIVAAPLPRVPNVVGKSASNAQRILENAGFQVSKRQETTSSAAPGNVIRQSPSAGTQRQPGSRVTITVAKKPPTSNTQPSNCTPGYSPCLPPASDYDCAGGTGDGPEYTGPVRVTGSDPYDLDSDNDGYGCES